MFGKTRDFLDHHAALDTSAIDGILGDEEAASAAAEMVDLRRRVEQAESQIASQLTSLATYAQIAQEQVELARSEARAQTERSEQRMTSLIERERADRTAALQGGPSGVSPELVERLDALERSVALLQHGLDDCRQQQKALAMAITTMFERVAPVKPVVITEAPRADVPLAPPSIDDCVAVDPWGPIAGLSLDG